MRQNGLRVEGDRGETLVRPAQATDDIAAIGPGDYVLLCVKLCDVESAGKQLRPIVGPNTAVVRVQNGVDAHERLIPILGRPAVMGGSAFVTGSIVAPGVVRQTGTYFQIMFGELDRRISPRGQRLSELCAAAGFEGILSPDIRVTLWEKFIGLGPVSRVNALARVPLARYRSVSDSGALIDPILRETVAVGRAEGVNRAPDGVERGLAMIG